MAELCVCPDDEILTEIPTAECAFDMDQVQKLAFATEGNVIWDSATGGGLGDGSPQVDSQVDTLADWQARRVAVDSTKIVVTPRIGADPIIEAGEQITSGGNDNSTFDGLVEDNGTGPSNFSVAFKSISTDQEVAMKGIRCKNPEVYFFLKGGLIACRKVKGTENHVGFRAYSYFLSDRNNAGFGTKDTHTMSFQLKEGWSEELVIVTPADFNPIYDLD